MIFKRTGEGRPSSDAGLSSRGWAALSPRRLRLDEDSTFYGDLFDDVAASQGDFCLKDGRCPALQQRPVVHARLLDLATLA